VFQNLLGGVGQKAAICPKGQHVIEGLVAIDRVQPGAVAGGEHRIDVEHDASERRVAVPDDLAEGE